MGNRLEKKRRRFMREECGKKINSMATLTLRREIFRLARIRDILGITIIVSVVVITILSILLFRHW
jgi:hypothetical protein